ncbi:patatin-like phospholipase family protein, partial [bacterium]|nr:patatin-like phospholipase family protein [bacterium]
MRGLVLEGGGAKGAFHLGAVKALYDYGYTFDGVSGTSIGAINGAIIAQEGGYQTLYNLWSNISPSDFTDFDDMMVAKMQNKEYDKETIIYWMKQSLKILKNVGVPTDKIIPFLKQYIDENQLRNSKIDYALVTYSVSDKKPMELYKEDIPYGKLHDYIFASAYYPAFRLNRLNGKFFVDGGVCDNLPLNTLARKGYDELFAIRTMSRMPHSIVADKSVKV